MAIPHAKPGQIINVGPLQTQLASAATSTLIKSDKFELLRLVLPAGKRIPPHQVPGEVVVQCVEGVVEFEARGKSVMLTPGTLLYLAGGDEHAVRAVEDASLLVTIFL
jgi:quercetin dioxygenase-like cupin family protein